MFDTILAIVAPVAICAAAGFLWVRFRQPYDADFVGRLVLAMAGYWAITFGLMLALGAVLVHGQFGRAFSAGFGRLQRRARVSRVLRQPDGVERVHLGGDGGRRLAPAALA